MSGPARRVGAGGDRAGDPSGDLASPTMPLGMDGHSDSRTWQNVFAAGLLLRPILVVPMASAGPLGGSDLLLTGLASVFAFHILVAAGVFVGNRPALALGILTALAGVVLAVVIGLYLRLPMPWPLVLAAYNAALVPVGVRAWEERSIAGGVDHPSPPGQ